MRHSKLLEELNQTTLTLTELVLEENRRLEQNDRMGLRELVERKTELSNRYIQCLKSLKKTGFDNNAASEDLIQNHARLNDALNLNEIILTAKIISSQNYLATIIDAVERSNRPVKTYTSRKKPTKRASQPLPLAVNETF
jgi:hypothetical protein